MTSSPTSLNPNNSATFPTTLHHHHRHADTNPLLPPPSSPTTQPPPVANETLEKSILLHAVEIEQPESSPGVSVPPFSWRKLWKFTGPGFLMSVAFLDPGNLEGDLQAGAIAGYSLLWLLMWATVMGLLIQLLSLRLGVATGRHLAEICREEYPHWAAVMLWFMAELALIAADIQEVIGSAIALRILSNGVVPLWAGSLITGFDCFMFLFLENYGIRKLEAFFAVLITSMAFSFAWMFFETKPSWRDLIEGIVIPKLRPETIPKAIGVIGCVITPYNVFLYSALVQSRKIDLKKKGRVQEALNYYTIESVMAVFVSFVINLFVTAVFAKGFYRSVGADSLGLVNAGEFLEKRYGGGLLPILYIWAIGLFAAGQSSTITGTYAGQFIMGGFLNLEIKKWVRSLITRSCAILPTVIVAVAFNRSEELLDVLNEWLNVLQAMQIPFAVIPLLHLVSNEHIMGAFMIGTVVKRISWGVAVLVILVNGYVLVDFFVTEVHGLLLGVVVCLVAASYTSILVYLIFRGHTLFSSRADGFSYIRTT
ncbi:Metal transporter Nramp2 [Striga hermonthica]|uniref:Metal transporter Nramp2 n=1 Tax=Striga hermonthica TaxID=68872 RepID=A0A9N7RI59_STRHE|nr:Metal transporter Nramp2 [Striga hermonthica]